LIRRDAVIVYIDDVLIPSETVKQNLETLAEVMVILKKYGFDLNLGNINFSKKP